MKAAADKGFVTLQARFALRGYVLNRSIGAADGFYVAKHGVVKWLSNLDDARAFLWQIGGGS